MTFRDIDCVGIVKSLILKGDYKEGERQLELLRETNSPDQAQIHFLESLIVKNKYLDSKSHYDHLQKAIAAHLKQVANIRVVSQVKIYGCQYINIWVDSSTFGH